MPIIPSRPTRKFWAGWAVALGVALLPVALATLPPFLGPAGRTLVMQAFAPLCHQIPAYSPHLGGVQLAVGHRIYGMLWGLVLGTVALLWLRRWDDALDQRAALVLGAAALPMALDWWLHAAGWWTKTPASRLATGLLFGLAAGYFLARAIVNLFIGPPSENPLQDPRPETASADTFSL